MAKYKTAIIYIPGLGDDKPRFQQFAVKQWRLYGYQPHFIQMKWNNDIHWSDKLQVLTIQIENLNKQNYKVVLIGASAGASAVINAYAVQTSSIDGVVTIAGKINHPETIGPKYHAENPSFIESINQAQKSLSGLTKQQIKNVMCCYSKKDGLVSKEDSIIKGAKIQQTRIPYHPLVIAYYLTFGFYRIHKHIRQLTKGV